MNKTLITIAIATNIIAGITAMDAYGIVNLLTAAFMMGFAVAWGVLGQASMSAVGESRHVATSA